MSPRRLQLAALLALAALSLLALWPDPGAAGGAAGAGAAATRAPSLPPLTSSPEPGAASAAVASTAAAAPSAVDSRPEPDAPEAATFDDPSHSPGPWDTRPGTITGRIFDPDGRPLPGADVQWSAGCTVECTTADADGRYALTQAPVTWLEVRVSPPLGRADLLGATVSLRVPAPAAEVPADVALPRACALVIVPDWPAAMLPPAAPPPGDDDEGGFRFGSTARIEVEPLGSAPGEDIQETGWLSADPRAPVSLSVPAGAWRVRVWDAERRAFGLAEVLVPPLGVTAHVAMRAPARIRGRVLDAAGAPLRAHVLARTQAHLGGGGLFADDDDDAAPLSEQESTLVPRALPEWSAQATCAPDGTFDLGWVPPGPVDLAVFPLDTIHAGQTHALTLAPGDDRTLTLRAVRVDPVAVRADRDLTDAAVSVVGPPGVGLTRGPGGALRVTGLPLGARAVVIASDDAYEPTWLASAEVRGGAPAVDLSATPGAGLVVRAVDPSGRPAGAGVRVQVTAALLGDLAWEAAFSGPLSFDDDEDEDGVEEVAPREGVHLWGPLSQVWDTRPDGLTDGSVTLHPGRWRVQVLGAPGAAQVVDLAPGDRRQVDVVVR